MATTSTQVHLVRRPNQWPTPQDFEVKKQELPPLRPGEILVRNTHFSVDPYMRGRMNDAASYVPPFALDEPLTGGAVGVVAESQADTVKPGECVLHQQGWRDTAIVNAAHARTVDPSKVSSPSAYLGVLGMTGLTAYVGLLDIANLRPGDTVFVSAAAGAVGQMAVQIAKLKGAGRVVGSAGTQTKVEYLKDRVGCDAVFNYRDGALTDQLRDAAPHGLDVYFDNVGGEHLEAALASMRLHGRIAACGAVSQYNAAQPPSAPRNLMLLVGKRLSMRGFIVGDHAHRMSDFVADVSNWLTSEKLVYDETIVDGVDNAPDAFIGMLGGSNVGKTIVRV